MLGEPWRVEIAPFRKHPALHVMGILYQGVPDADDAWALMKALEDPRNAARRRLGWSVQGSVDQLQADTVLQCTVNQLALTHEPVNPFTFAALARSLRRSLTTGMTTGTAAPLRLQDLDSGTTEVLYGPCVADHYDASSRRFRSAGAAFRHLVICRGYRPEDAYTILRTVAPDVVATKEAS